VHLYSFFLFDNVLITDFALMLLIAEVDEFVIFDYAFFYCVMVHVCFSRIVSESKTLVNGIDAYPEQTVTVGQNNVGNNSLTEEQSSDLCLPPEPAKSPLADSTEASVSDSSCFTGLTSVVDSPSSYPKWCDSETTVCSQSSVTSGASKSGRLSSLVFDGDVDDDEVEPPAKRQLLDHTSSTGDDVSTTTVFSPLLCQLLSMSVEKSEKQSADNNAVDGSDADSVTDGTDQSPNTDKNAEVTPDSEVEDEDEGLSDVLTSQLNFDFVCYIISWKILSNIVVY